MADNPPSTEPLEKRESSLGNPTSFWAELKRRKVMRVAITYAVVAWLLIQVSAIIFPQFGIPEWAARLVTIVLFIGFPIALIIAWAFELTPDGMKTTKSADEKRDDAPVSKKRLRKQNWLTIGFAAGLPTLIFGALAFYFYFGSRSSESDLASEDRPYFLGSIAVLPIEVISGQEEMNAIADGLHEEILTQLSLMDPLDVVSRTSTLQYRDPAKSIVTIAGELGADFVLEGSVQKLGDTWRLVLQLIEASDDVHLESTTYDRPLTDDGDLADQKILAWRAAIGTYRRLNEEFPPSKKISKQRDDWVAKKRTELMEIDSEFWENPEARISLINSIMEKSQEFISADPLLGEPYRRRLTYFGQVAGGRGYDPVSWVDEMKLYSEQALEMDSGHFDTHIHTGTFHMFALSRPDLAIPYLQAGLDLYEKNAEFSHNWPYYHLSRAHFLTGSPVVSLKILERVPEEVEFTHLVFWRDAFEFSRQFENGIEFLELQLARANQAGDTYNILDISRQIAEFNAWWEGSSRAVEEHYESVAGDPNATEGYKGRLLFFMRRYREALEMIETMDPGSDRFAPDYLELIQYRGIALRETGHLELSQSYLEQSLENLSNNVGLFAAEPGLGYALVSVLNAYLRNEDASLEAMAKAESYHDAAVNLPVYYLIQGLIAQAYFELGDYDNSLKKIELLLSGPSGTSAGRVLLDFNEPELYSNSEFQTLIRKYSHQLRDPAILDSLFGEEK